MDMPAFVTPLGLPPIRSFRSSCNSRPDNSLPLLRLPVSSLLSPLSFLSSTTTASHVIESLPSLASAVRWNK